MCPLCLGTLNLLKNFLFVVRNTLLRYSHLVFPLCSSVFTGVSSPISCSHSGKVSPISVNSLPWSSHSAKVFLSSHSDMVYPIFRSVPASSAYFSKLFPLCQFVLTLLNCYPCPELSFHFVEVFPLSAPTLSKVFRLAKLFTRSLSTLSRCYPSFKVLPICRSAPH